MTNYEKPVGCPRGRNVVCQEDASGSYTLERSSLELFANYKRLAAKLLISSVNEERVLRDVTRRSSRLSIIFRCDIIVGKCTLYNLTPEFSYLAEREREREKI